MPRRTPPGDEAEPQRPPLRPENGYYFLVEVDGGEFDWRPKDGSFDPPRGQDQLAQKVRRLYVWIADHAQPEATYIQFRDRLRAVFQAGAVNEPINRRTAGPLAEIETEVLAHANERLDGAAQWMALTCLVVGAVLGLGFALCVYLGPADFQHYCNFILLGAVAVIVAGLLARARTPITDLDQYRLEARKFAVPVLEAAQVAVLSVGIAVCVQNKWLTLQIGGSPIDVTGSALQAVGLGFILGIASSKLLKISASLTDALRPARGRQTQGRVQPG